MTRRSGEPLCTTRVGGYYSATRQRGERTRWSTRAFSGPPVSGATPRPRSRLSFWRSSLLQVDGAAAHGNGAPRAFRRRASRTEESRAAGALEPSAVSGARKLFKNCRCAARARPFGPRRRRTKERSGLSSSINGAVSPFWRFSTLFDALSARSRSAGRQVGQASGDVTGPASRCAQVDADAHTRTAGKKRNRYFIYLFIRIRTAVVWGVKATRFSGSPSSRFRRSVVAVPTRAATATTRLKAPSAKRPPPFRSG